MDALVKSISDLFYWGFERFGRYYSKYRAFVVDRNDPKHYGRLKLIIPHITGEETHGTWAWPSNFSGKGYGSQVLPKKNDVVWVEFEFGNPRKPLWSHGYFGQGEKPDDLKDYDNYWFKTPGGHIVELDDTNNLIRITSKDKVYIIKDGNTSSSAALGDEVQDRLEALTDILISTTVNGNPLSSVGQLTTFKSTLGTVKSNTINISK